MRLEVDVGLQGMDARDPFSIGHALEDAVAGREHEPDVRTTWVLPEPECGELRWRGPSLHVPGHEAETGETGQEPRRREAGRGTRDPQGPHLPCEPPEEGVARSGGGMAADDGMLREVVRLAPRVEQPARIEGANGAVPPA
jgi:hypothetical protein